MTDLDVLIMRRMAETGLAYSFDEIMKFCELLFDTHQQYSSKARKLKRRLDRLLCIGFLIEQDVLQHAYGKKEVLYRATLSIKTKR